MTSPPIRSRAGVFVISAATASLLVLTSAPARADLVGAPTQADESARRSVDAPARTWAITAEATPGFASFFNNGESPSYAIGGEAIFRYRMIQIGAFREATVEPRVRGLKSQATGGMIGVRVFANSLRGFDAVLTAGGHEFQGVGSEQLLGSLGSSGSAPFLGLRLGGSATLGHGPVRLLAGLWLFSLFDLTRHSVAVTRSADIGPPEDVHAAIGDVEIGLSVRVGLEIGPR